ncbi:MAG: CNNM domain-containing protein [Planctomycetaceae bacterium]|nr:CNNM domain-containing protein [Planctomycetaceae bacterium]
MMNLFYSLLILILMFLSAIFSGSETGVYRLSRFRLRLGAEQHRRPYVRLFKLIQDGQNLILLLLLSNNIVNYLITFLFTYMVFSATQSKRTAELYSSAVLTPVVFIFCEMLPKSIFYHKSDRLMPRLAFLLHVIYSFFVWSGLLRLFKHVFEVINRMLLGRPNTVHAVETTQRMQVSQIIHETQEEGLLSDVQKDMIQRLIQIPEIAVDSVMVPLSRFAKVPVTADRQELLSALQNSRLSTHLVYQGTPENVLGYVSLAQALSMPEPLRLENFTRLLVRIDRADSVIQAIALLRKKKEKIALVTEHVRDHSRPVGVITMTDLIEELTGEVAA